MPSAVSPRLRFRRAADFTALRLGRAVLGYLALTTAVITLAPFRFVATPAHGLTSLWTPYDLAMNVLLFIPFGFVFALTRPRGAPARWWQVLLLSAGLSAAIEIAQLFAPERFSSLLDVAANTSGALLGAALFDGARRRVASDEAVLSLALELPLMGLVYLLVPLAWLLGLGTAGDERRILLLPLAVIAGAILGTVHAAYVSPASPGSRQQRRWWLLGLPTGWVLVSIVPGARGEWDIVAAALGVIVPAAIYRESVTRRHAHLGRQRFELPTLRLVLPLFAAYLTLSSLWPLTEVSPAWHGTMALALPDVPLAQPWIWRTLEHLAAFTLVGYIGAEFHGRDRRRLRHILPRVLAFTVAASGLLELARGFDAAAGASALLFALTQATAVFGAHVYVLQRAHVQALVKRRARLAALAAVDASAPASLLPAAA